MIEAQLNVSKSNLTVDLQHELELKLRECIGKNVVLRYWNDSYEFHDECIIEDYASIVTIRKNDDLIFIYFDPIYSVNEYDYLVVL